MKVSIHGVALGDSEPTVRERLGPPSRDEVHMPGGSVMLTYKGGPTLTLGGEGEVSLIGGRRAEVKGTGELDHSSTPERVKELLGPPDGCRIGADALVYFGLKLTADFSRVSDCWFWCGRDAPGGRDFLDGESAIHASPIPDDRYRLRFRGALELKSAHVTFRRLANSDRAPELERTLHELKRAMADNEVETIRTSLLLLRDFEAVEKELRFSRSQPRTEPAIRSEGIELFRQALAQSRAGDHQASRETLRQKIEIDIRELTEALERWPDRAELYYSRHLAHASRGETDRAAADLQRATELDPTCSFLW
ncbi:MAG: hypothetical protein HY319_24330 [Armatimonadetes bacterium]|nr:hypothetical protein [Armatimonadota bacterium]